MSFHNLSKHSIFLLLLYPLVLAQSPPCPRGHYASTASSTSPSATCVPCPAGTYLPTTGALALDLCIECPPNTFSTALGATSRATCTPCPRGQASRSGANRCLACRPGTRIQPCPIPPGILRGGFSMSFFRGECFFLPDGPDPFVSPAGVQNLRCERCPRGTISTQRNSLNCERCPEGMAPNDDRSMCVRPTCPPGQGVMDGVCRRCISGFIADEQNGICTECPSGQVPRTISGARECRPCPEGTSRQGANFCRPCRSNQDNRNVTGAQFCLPALRNCPSNFFVGNGGACKTCTKRQRYDVASNNCVPCPLNTLSSGELDTRCRRCPRGMVVDRLEEACVCQRGWGWIAGSGRTRCARCPPGTSSFGNQFCRSCEPDSVAPTRGMAFCTPCGDTLAQPLPGQRRCVRRRCPSGLVPSGHAGCVLPTTNCPPGLERFEVDGLIPDCIARSAENCTAGTVFLRTGFGPPICGTCRRGERYDRDLQRCIRCPEGFTSEGGILETCEECPLGFRFVDGECRCAGGRRLEQGRCLSCPAGTFGFLNVDGCQLCPVGSASNRVGGTNQGRNFPCDRCIEGRFAGNPGSTVCEACTRRLTTFRIGENECVALA